MNIVNILLGLLFGVIAYELGSTLWRNRYRAPYILSVWRRFTPILLVEVVLVYTAASALIYVLWAYVPGLGWGWYNLLNRGGGNYFIAAPADFLAKPLAVGFFLLVILLLPFLAEYEEKAFRKGKHKPDEWIPASIAFGFIHLIMGIPIAVGFGLTVVGLALAWKYLTSYERYLEEHPYARLYDAEDEGVQSSIAMHTLANTIMVSFVALGVIIT